MARNMIDSVLRPEKLLYLHYGNLPEERKAANKDAKRDFIALRSIGNANPRA